MIDEDGVVREKQGDKLVEADELRPGHEPRIRSFIDLRNATNNLMRMQVDPESTDAEIEAGRVALNKAYDRFVKKFGPVNKPFNVHAFRNDPMVPRVMSLEDYDDESKTAKKTAIFTKRTQRPRRAHTTADSPEQALAFSLSEKGRVDLPWMADLLGRDEDQVANDLRGTIFRLPEGGYEIRDIYLSGNVRDKLLQARQHDAIAGGFDENIRALEAVQPDWIPVEQIELSMGAPWVPTDVYNDFIQHITQSRFPIRVAYNRNEGTWVVNDPRGGPSEREMTDWGTERRPFLDLFQRITNHRDLAVRSRNADGSTSLDADETAAARAAADEITREFDRWVWADQDRAERLASIYNQTFNTTVPQQFDGSHLALPGSATVSVFPHVKNAIWRFLSNGNTLLGHAVGAGKTWSMTGMAMEGRRLGLVKKAVVVTPNHIVQQFGREALQMYPGAKVLVADPKKDFTPRNRQKFLNRIATGDWDLVVIPMSSVEKMPMSPGRVSEFFQDQLAQLARDIAEAKAERGTDNRNYVKELENAKSRLENLMEKQLNVHKKDPGPYFDELGIDLLMVDEAHEYKNLWFRTKMGRMPGVANSLTQRSFDLLLKSQHINEVTGGRGMVLATGTPLANAIPELYTMQRYIQPGALQAGGVEAFDSWASVFGATETKAEITPTGEGVKVKTRFAQFRNAAQLRQMMEPVLDVIQSKDLNLKRPKVRGGHHEVVEVERAPEVADYIQFLLRRADAVSGGSVDPSHDNMLAITTDGRKAALDYRLIDPDSPPRPDDRIGTAATNVHAIWEETKATKGTQIVWMDLGAPGGKAGIDLYADLRERLVEKGIPRRQIAFAQDSTNEKKRSTQHRDVREGKIRVLIASTRLLGTGANIQRRLVAAHHLDAPWRPADIEQRDGRIIRTGNENEEVRILRYITPATFDAFMWQTLERKAKFIEDFWDGNAVGLDDADLDSTSLSFAEIKALATGNPLILEFTQIQSDLRAMEGRERVHNRQQRDVQFELNAVPNRIEAAQKRKADALIDMDLAQAVADGSLRGDNFSMEVQGVVYETHKEAGEALEPALVEGRTAAFGSAVPFRTVGRIGGFEVQYGKVKYDTPSARIIGPSGRPYETKFEDSATGNIQRLINRIVDITTAPDGADRRIREEEARAKRLAPLIKPFEQAAEITALRTKMREIEAKLQGSKISHSAVTGTLNRLERAVDQMIENAALRMAGRAEQGVTLFSGVDPTRLGPDLLDASVWLAGHFIKGTIKVSKAAAALVDEFGPAVGPHVEQIIRQAREIEGRLTGILADPPAEERVEAAVQKAAPKAPRPGATEESRVIASAFRAGVENVRAQLAAIRAEVREREKQKHAARAGEVEARRREIRELIEQNLPISVRGRFIPDLMRAKSLGDVAKSIDKIRRELARHTAAKDLARVRRFSKQKAADLLTGDDRDDFRKLRAGGGRPSGRVPTPGPAGDGRDGGRRRASVRDRGGHGDDPRDGQGRPGGVPCRPAGDPRAAPTDPHPSPAEGEEAASGPTAPPRGPDPLPDRAVRREPRRPAEHGDGGRGRLGRLGRPARRRVRPPGRGP